MHKLFHAIVLSSASLVAACGGKTAEPPASDAGDARSDSPIDTSSDTFPSITPIRVDSAIDTFPGIRPPGEDTRGDTFATIMADTAGFDTFPGISPAPADTFAPIK